jgi:hypothetical protein
MEILRETRDRTHHKPDEQAADQVAFSRLLLIQSCVSQAASFLPIPILSECRLHMDNDCARDRRGQIDGRVPQSTIPKFRSITSDLWAIRRRDVSWKSISASRLSNCPRSSRLRALDRAAYAAIRANASDHPLGLDNLAYCGAPPYLTRRPRRAFKNLHGSPTFPDTSQTGDFPHADRERL